MSEYEYPDLDFHHHLYDTLILLGAPKDIAELVKKCMDGVTPRHIDRIRNYNIELFTAAKTRLVNLNRMKITNEDQND